MEYVGATAAGLAAGLALTIINSRYGLIFKPRLVRSVLPSGVMIGVDYKGPYPGVGKPMNELYHKLIHDESLAQAIPDLEPRLTVGVTQSFDNPKRVPKAECRAFVGSMLYEATDDEIAALHNAGYKLRQFHGHLYDNVQCPKKSTPGMIIGIIRGYSLISKSDVFPAMHNKLDMLEGDCVVEFCDEAGQKTIIVPHAVVTDL